MSKKSRHFFRMTPLAVALLAAHGPVLAQSTEGSLSIGAGNWSNDRPQTGVYDGMRDSGGYGLLDLDVVRRDEATGTWLGLKGRYLGLDIREIKADWLRQGNIGASLDYNRIVRETPFVFNTGLVGIGTTTQLVPTPSITPGTGADVELKTTRERLTGKFYKNLMAGLDFNASYRHETKKGNRNWGRGGAPEFVAEPIDSTIEIGEAALTFSRGALQLTGGFYGTWYKTDNTLVTTSLTNGASPFYLSLPLDNQSWEGYLNGGYNFTPTTRGTFKASYSRATQNEHLPTADIPGLASPLAPENLNGRLDTTVLEAALNSRPMRELSIAATLRYRDFDDKTPVQQYVIAGAGAPVYNTPFSYTNHVGKLDATYRLPMAYSALAGVEYNGQNRSVPTVGTLWVPFRAEVDETTYRLGLSKSMSDTVNGSVRWEYASRDGDSYTLPNNPANPLQDNINPLNISDRTRNKWRALVDWSPTDKLSLQFGFSDAKDDYNGPNSYGLQKGKAQNYTVDGSYRLTSTWQFNAWYSYDLNKANEATQNSGAGTPTKFNELKETDNSYGAGVKGLLFDKLKVGLNVEQFKTKNKYEQNIVGATLPATQVPTPDVNNRLTRIKLNADYPVQKTAEVRLSVIHEKWKTDDWTWMMFPASGPTPWAYGTANDGTTVTSDSNYNSTFVGVRYVYKF
ncbi:MAG TPA: MtrB/PioB family decaheme-associated outer membrane protein [Burkholderiales bacterium]|nr:MtrB/PioB family decaheme-associated outer membrane protein [Burkholderiales bacterium]